MDNKNYGFARTGTGVYRDIQSSSVAGNLAIKQPFSFRAWFLSLPNRLLRWVQWMWYYSRRSMWMLSISSIVFLLPYMAGVYIEENEEVAKLENMRGGQMM